jgi:methionyl-tRNA formyltransferase
MMTFAVVGAVGSTATTLTTLLRLGADVRGVAGLSPQRSTDNSDFVDIAELGRQNGLLARSFDSVNEAGNVAYLKDLSADYILFVGLSQIVRRPTRAAAVRMSVGLHPTALPRFRGRAALSWLILLGIRDSAVTLFELEDDPDSGAILVQQPYRIGATDYLGDVMASVNTATALAVSQMFQLVEADRLRPVPQASTDASCLLRRVPADGLIDFAEPGEHIERLIRAVSKPFPGAYSYYEGRRVTFWRGHQQQLSIATYGRPGQIINVDDEGVHVLLTSSSELVITDFDIDEPTHFRPGHCFGVREHDEVQALRARVAALEATIRRLQG